jgi:uncharacterized membrane protein YecN with MAPEG domain
MITGTYASFLALLLVILSFRVIALRGYAPVFLILMLIAEMGGLKDNALHSYGTVFVIARLMHGYCFGFLKHNMVLRVGGTSLTLFSILGLAILVLTRYSS